MSLTLPQCFTSIRLAALPLLSSLVPLMAPKRGVGRGRVRRGRGGRTPCSCLGGRHGAAPVPSSSPLEEGFWRYDFLLHVRGQSANRVLLPSAFSAIVSERGLDGLLLHLKGSYRS